MEATVGTVAKGAVVVGVGSVGGYGIYSAIPGKGAIPEIPPKFLFQTEGFGTSGDYTKSSNNFGYAFGRFMLDPDVNSSLWEKKEKELSDFPKEQINNEFKSVKEEGNEKKTLREVCKGVYKKAKTEVKDETNNLLLTYTWQYCSVAKFKASTIDEFDSDKNKYTGKWARESDNAKALFSITSASDNDEPVWNHIYENILKKDLSDENKKTTINAKFKTVNSGDGLSDLCKDAYDTVAKDSDSNNYGKSVIEYCVLDASVEVKKFPTEPAG